jgi:hypothetical protein
LSIAEAGRTTMTWTNTILNVVFTFEVVVLIVWQGFTAYRWVSLML